MKIFLDFGTQTTFSSSDVAGAGMELRLTKIKNNQQIVMYKIHALSENVEIKLMGYFCSLFIILLGTIFGKMYLSNVITMTGIVIVA